VKLEHVEGNLYRQAAGKGRFRYLYRQSVRFFENGEKADKEVRWQRVTNLEHAMKLTRESDEECENMRKGVKPKTMLTLGMLGDWYRERMHRYNLRSAEQRWRNIKTFIEYAGRERPVASLVRKDFKTYREKLVTDGLDNDTINAKIRDLKTMYSRAIEDEVEGMVEASPVIGIRPMKETLPVTRIPTLEQLQTIMDASPPWLQRIVLVMATTGLRPADVQNLDWESIDLANSEIRLTERKTGKQNVVPIPTKLEKAIWEWTGGTAPAKGLVFPNPRKSGRPYSNSGVLVELKRVGARVGLGWITQKALRKFVATEIKRRKGIDAAKKQLNHADSKTTEHYYIVGAVGDVKDQREALNDLWDEKPLK
jgi:integrase